jgi:hypothetical protein
VFISRRQFLGRAGTGLLLAESQLLQAQRTSAMSPHAPSAPVPSQSKVAVIHRQERRKIVHVALAAIDEQIKPKLAGKRYVVIKPNGLAAENPLASTNADTVRGILDYLMPRSRGPVVIAESSSGDTLEVLERHHYEPLVAEYTKLSLTDLNREAKLDKIDVVGANLASVKRSYRLHPDIQRELKWMGPMEGLPPILGELRQRSDKASA